MVLDNSSRCCRIIVALNFYLSDLVKIPSKLFQSADDHASPLVGSIPNSSNLIVGELLAFSIFSSC